MFLFTKIRHRGPCSVSFQLLLSSFHITWHDSRRYPDLVNSAHFTTKVVWHMKPCPLVNGYWCLDDRTAFFGVKQVELDCLTLGSRSSITENVESKSIPLCEFNISLEIAICTTSCAICLSSGSFPSLFKRINATDDNLIEGSGNKIYERHTASSLYGSSKACL